MTYFALNLTRIYKDIENIKKSENKTDTVEKTLEKTLESPKKVIRGVIKKNKSMDDFMKMQWPWLF